MTTAIYNLPDWAAAQATPWNGHNQALRIVEAVVRGLVLDRDLTAPPGACADGATYLVDTPATGAWATHEGEMAISVGVNAANGWLFAPIATEGFLLFVDDEDVRLEYRSDLSPAGWLEFSGGGGGIAEAPIDGLPYVRRNGAWEPETKELVIACSDETTAITAAANKVKFRMPFAMTLTAVRASVSTAPTGANLVIDINEAGGTILSTKLSIDAGETTSTTAATPAVISDANLADDAEITIDFDTVGSTIAGAGVKVTLIGNRA